MTPTQLRAFVAIVRHGSAKGAAEELGVSEAAISSHTAALRKELGDPLFERSSSGIVFTPGGLRLATRAVEMLGLQDQTRREVQAATDGKRLLRIAATSMFAEYAAPGLIDAFSSRAKDLQVELSVHSSRRFASLLETRQVDVAIGPSALPNAPLQVGPPVLTTPFLRYQLLVVAGRDHPAAKNPRNELPKATWVLGPSVIERQGAVAHIVRHFKVEDTAQRIYQSHGAALAAIQAGEGVGIVPEFRVKQMIAEHRVQRVEIAGGQSPGTWQTATLPGTQAPPIARELVRFVTTPKAIQAMLSGSAANVRTFRPSVHITLWS